MRGYHGTRIDDLYDLLFQLKKECTVPKTYELFRTLQRGIGEYEMSGKTDPVTVNRLYGALSDLLRDSASGVNAQEDLESAIESTIGILKSGKLQRYEEKLSADGKSIQELIDRLSYSGLCSAAVYARREEAVKELRILRDTILRCTPQKEGHLPRRTGVLTEERILSLRALLLADTYEEFLCGIEEFTLSLTMKSGLSCAGREIARTAAYVNGLILRMQSEMNRLSARIKSASRRLDEYEIQMAEALVRGERDEADMIEARIEDVEEDMATARRDIADLSANLRGYTRLLRLVEKKLRENVGRSDMIRRIEQIFRLETVRRIERNPTHYAYVMKMLEGVGGAVIPREVYSPMAVREKKTAEGAEARPLSPRQQRALEMRLRRENAEAEIVGEEKPISLKEARGGISDVV